MKPAGIAFSMFYQPAIFGDKKVFVKNRLIVSFIIKQVVAIVGCMVAILGCV